ncbi:MAG TPA: multicopper oxidase [Actinomadura sp.]|nr:multicopper oxidase [Actinomadura sp.]
MGLTRREFTRLAAAAGIGAAGFTKSTKAGATTVRLEKYVDPLPSIPVAAPRKSVYPRADYYELTMRQRPWRFHRDLGRAAAWGYWASNPSDPARPIGLGYLGPTIVTPEHRPVVVRYRNELPPAHLLGSAMDVTLWKNLPGVPPDPPGGRMPRDLPDRAAVWAVPHLHGGFSSPQFDGSPEGWFTSDGLHGPKYASLKGARSNEAVYAYTNNQCATLLWYHDHAMAITRLNIYAGLAGPYVIRDPAEERLGLPEGAYEVPLVIQDRTFNPDGSLFYPAKGVTSYHPRWVPEFFGETPVVNGKAYPFLAVEPRRYRLRILNGSDARFYRMWFDDRGTRLPFWLIGTEGGFRGPPLELSEIFLAPAERADVIIDFGRLRQGSHVTLMNDAAAPYPGGGGGPAMPEIMRFQVTDPLSGTDRTTRPEALRLPRITPLSPTPGISPRELVLSETSDRAGNPVHMQINRRFFYEDVEETPRLGTTEIWTYVNTTEDAHPMHVHLVQFQVHNRQKADTAAYEKDYDAWVAAGRRPGAKPVLARYLIGEPIPPEPQEMGWKDTFKVYPGMVGRIIATFDLPHRIAEIPGTGPHVPAEYIHHCHILEHEDNEMMRPWKVVA